MLERAWAAGLEPAWVSSNQRVWSDGYQVPVAQLADACLEPDGWRWQVADGAKGPQQDEWAAGRMGASMDQRLVRWLLVRRSCRDPSERAYYLCAASPETTAQQPLAYRSLL